MNQATRLAADIERRVRCPACQQWCIYSTRNPYRPFCCAACKGLDLGAWASESFRVPQEAPSDAAFDEANPH